MLGKAFLKRRYKLSAVDAGMCAALGLGLLALDVVADEALGRQAELAKARLIANAIKAGAVPIDHARRWVKGPSL